MGHSQGKKSSESRTSMYCNCGCTDSEEVGSRRLASELHSRADPLDCTVWRQFLLYYDETISELVFTSTSSWQLDRTRCTVKPLLSNQHLLTVYFAMFHSRVSCGIELWGGAAACRQVLLIQNKPIRLIYFWNILAVGRYGYDLDMLYQYWGNLYVTWKQVKWKFWQQVQQLCAFKKGPVIHLDA